MYQIPERAISPVGVKEKTSHGVDERRCGRQEAEGDSQSPTQIPFALFTYIPSSPFLL